MVPDAGKKGEEADNEIGKVTKPLEGHYEIREV
jgi:hypothetical protein